MQDPEYLKKLRDQENFVLLKEKMRVESANRAAAPGGSGYRGPRGTYQVKERR